jgi:hypothetical protein
MIRDLQSRDADGSKERGRTGHRFTAIANRILLAAVAGLASGLARATVDWLLQQFTGF